MEDVVGILVREANGERAAFVTWGRLYGAAEEGQLLDAIRPHLPACGIATDAELEVCPSLSAVSAFPYFFEALLAFAREPIEFGKSYDKWLKRKRKAIEKGREIYFLGRLGPDRGAEPTDTTPSSREVVVQSSADDIVGPFLHAVRTGRIDDVRAALADDPAIVNARGPHPFWGGRPQALHVAIESKRREMVDLVLQAGADVNGVNDEYDLWSPLMCAITSGDLDVTQELLRRGARVGLAEALLAEDDAALEHLMKTSPGLPAEVPNHGSFLHLARTTFAIDRLIEAGASATAANRWGATPIESMSRLGSKGHPLVRHMMAVHGTQAQPADFARMGDWETLEAVGGANPEAIKSDVVFMGAVEFRHHGLVEWLLARGANVNARSDDSSHHAALHTAAWNGDLRMARILVDAGADLAAIDEEHHGTPFNWAEAAANVTNNLKCRDVAEYLRHAALRK